MRLTEAQLELMKKRDRNSDIDLEPSRDKFLDAAIFVIKTDREDRRALLGEVELLHEALERDEKRRAATEALASAFSTRRRMQSDNVEYTESQFREAHNAVEKAIDSFDALAPTPKEKE